jgi:hypothetical protein
MALITNSFKLSNTDDQEVVFPKIFGLKCNFKCIQTKKKFHIMQPIQNLQNYRFQSGHRFKAVSERTLEPGKAHGGLAHRRLRLHRLQGNSHQQGSVHQVHDE